MKTIALVTGNAGKLKEWQRLFPAQVKLEAIDLDLDEIQSLDLDAIALDKARRAYAEVGKPVLVEDVSAGLTKLHGLPGPFIKYFEIAMGTDALFQLAGAAGEAAVVTAVIAYHDGTVSLTARGDVGGTVVPARGTNGFGFDACFVPGGQTGQPKTYAEMSAAEKDAVSHRSKALRIMIRQLGLATGA